MKFYLRSVAIVVLSLLLSVEETFSQCVVPQSLAFTNPSFEGPAGAGITPAPWTVCMPGQTPDTQPGEWGVTMPAENGNTYLGLVAEPSANWQEGASEQLPTPMIAGVTYTFTVWLANSSTTGGGIDPGCAECQIWGGFGACDDNTGTGVLLWHSGNIAPMDTWIQYAVSFTPTQNFTWVMFRINSLGCSTEPYILVDNISTITGANVFATIDSTNILCAGGANGTATVHAMGNNPPFTYSWSTLPPGTDSTVTGLSAGTYTVTVTDNNTCTNTATVNITQPAPIVLTPTIVNYGCAGSGVLSYAGSAYMSYTGGVPPVIFTWSNGVSGQGDSSLFAGTYGVTATDANNCTATASVVITQPGGITDTVTTVQTNCGGSTGSATVTVLTGATPFTYMWSTGGTGTTISNLAAGTYTVTIHDNNGCVAVGTAVILATNGFTVSASSTPTTCGASNGTAWVTITNGSDPPYTYNWSNGGSTDTITNLPGGPYTVTVTGPGGCSGTASVNVGTSTGITFGPPVIQNILCHGDSSGKIVVSTTNGIPPIIYDWSPGTFGHADSISGLGANTYTVIATDRFGCTASASYTVSQPTALVIDTSVVTPIHCSTTGSIVVSATGGTAPLTYTWSPNVGTTDSVANLIAGTYALTITDSNSCSVTASYTLAPGPSGLNLDSSKVTDVTCNGSGNGEIIVYVSGGSGPITYVWNVSGTSDTLTGLSPGTYSVTATDTSGCSVSATDSITQPLAVIITSDSITNVSCNGGSNGSISIVASGGTGVIIYKWSNSDSTATVSGLDSGTYTVTVNDAHGCSVTASYTVGQPSAIVIDSTVITQEGCTTGGTIVVGAHGGTGTLAYTWSNGDTGDSIGNLGAAIYVLTITDQNGCSITASDTVTAAPGAITFTPAILVEPTCNGGNNGSITDSASGGTGTLIYIWSNGGTNDSIAGLTAGNYSLTVTDIVPCSASLSFVLNQPAAVTFNAPVLVEPACNGGNNGSITASASGGTGTIIYTWSNIETGATDTALTMGTYSVTATDSLGCSASTTYTLNQPAALIFGTPIIDSVLCSGGNTGSITAIASGGTGTIIYTWSNIETGAKDTALTAGTYTLTVTDSLGCSASITYTVGQPTPLVIDSAVLTQATCSAGGCITVTASGGTGTLSYSWSNSGTTSSQCNLPSGPYSLTITDQNGCSITASYTITTLNGGLVLDSASLSEPKCHGDNTGSIIITATDSASTIKYTWSNNISDSTSVDSNLNAGTYTVTLTDSLGCSASASYTLGQPSAVVIDSVMLSPVTCLTTGCAHVYASGGTGPLSYAWSNLATGDSICGLPGGSIDVIVLDQNLCFVTASYFIQVANSTLGVGPATITQPPCNGDSTGSITVHTTGGTAPIDYAWNYRNDSTATITGLQGGTYTVTITDAHGCSLDTTYTLINPPALIIDSAVVTQVTCLAGGTVRVFATGGTGNLTYTWTGTVQTGDSIFGLSAGTYVVTIRDVNGCSATQSYTVPGAPGAVVIDTGIVTNEICHGGNTGGITVIATGGTGTLSYIWSPAPVADSLATITGLTAGTYCVTAHDVTGCSATACYPVNEPTAIVVNSFVTTDATCTGLGAIHVIASGGTGTLIYRWSGTSQTGDSITGLTAGIYNLTITDSSGCSITATDSVGTAPGTITITGNVAINPTCVVGGSITITAVGGVGVLGYHWNYQNDSTASISNLPAGIYDVTVSDVNGCSTSAADTLIAPPGFTVNVIFGAIICSGTSDSAVAIPNGGTGPYSYSWSNGPVTQADPILPAGPFCVTVTDHNGCTASRCDTVAQSPPLQVTLLDSFSKCVYPEFGKVTIVATGGPGGAFVYEINPGTGPIVNSNGLFGDEPAGNYTFSVTDTQGCSLSGSFATPIGTPLDSFGVQADSVPCGGIPDGTITVISLPVDSSGGPFTYSADGGAGQSSNILTNLTAGNHTITVVNASGCSSSYSATIYTTNPIDSFTITTDSVSCFGAQDGSVSITPLPSDSAAGPYQYSFNGQGFASVSTFDSLAGGSYQIVVHNGAGCPDTLDATVYQPAPVAIGFNPDTVTTEATYGVQLNPLISNFVNPVFNWTPGMGLSCSNCEDPTATVTMPTLFYVTVSDSLNSHCTATDSIWVLLKGQFAMPNAFTPNGDGKDDFFGPVQYSYAVIKEFHIYNRWGQLVHNSTDYWDGNFNGKAQPPGTYVYYIEVQYPDPVTPTTTDTQKQEGAVTLLR